jgi:uncharacterized membrane protein YvbJ
VYCPNCGKKLGALNQKYCRYCGVKLARTATISQLPSKQAKNIEKGATGKNSKNCYIISKISFLLTIISIIIAFSLIFIIS